MLATKQSCSSPQGSASNTKERSGNPKGSAGNTEPSTKEWLAKIILQSCSHFSARTTPPRRTSRNLNPRLVEPSGRPGPPRWETRVLSDQAAAGLVSPAACAVGRVGLQWSCWRGVPPRERRLPLTAPLNGPARPPAPLCAELQLAGASRPNPGRPEERNAGRAC